MIHTEKRAHVLDVLRQKTWGELGILEARGYTMFPSEVVRRVGSEVERIPVLLRVPREPDLRAARLDARKMAHEAGLDPKLDADLIRNYEVICTLARVMHNPEPPNYEPWEPFPNELEKNYDREVLMHVWQQIDELRRLVDPMPDELTPDEFLALVTSIAKGRSVLPLAVFGQDAQAGCIITMASRLCDSLPSKSSSALSADSIAEPSPEIASST